MGEPVLTRFTLRGVTLLGDESRPGGVTFAFTERTGGVSRGCYSSLNLGDACGDAPELVRRNRAILLEAIGAGGLMDRLVNPKQVHGDRVVVVRSGSPEDVGEAQRQAREGADAVVCRSEAVPVLLCYADCTPVVLVAPHAFAVIHSGWRGTIARISAKALNVLCQEAGCTAGDVWAYVGPHIGGSDYEVSCDLMERFRQEFGDIIEESYRHLDLGAAVRAALLDAGMSPDCIVDADVSTASATDRYFSYRAEGGHCGRHGAVAYLPAQNRAQME